MSVLVLEPLNRPCLGGEVDPNLIELTRIGQIRLGITLVLDLLQSLFGRTVQLEFENIDVVRCFHNAIDPALALFLLDEDGIDADHPEDQVDRVLEIAFAFHRIPFALHPVRSFRQQGGQELFELVQVTRFQGICQILKPTVSRADLFEITG